MKWLPSLLSVIMLVGGQSSREKPAPKPPDPRPAIIRKLTKSMPDGKTARLILVVLGAEMATGDLRRA